MVVVTFLSAIFFALVLSLLLPKIYEAKVVLFVPAGISNVSFTSQENTAGLTQTPLFPVPDDDVAALQIGILQSKNVAQKVAKEFPQKGMDDLKRDVDFVMNSQYFIEVYVRDRDPGLAAKIANAYPKYFNDFQRYAALSRIREARIALEGQIEDVSKNIALTKREKEELQRRHRSVLVEFETERLTDQRNQFQTDLDKTFIAVQETEEKIKNTREQLEAEARNYNPSEVITTNTLIDGLRSKLTDLEGQLSSMKTELRPDHPKVVSALAQYEQTKKSLDVEIGRIVESHTKTSDSFHESLRRDLITSYVNKEVHRARISALKETINRIDNKLLDMSGLRPKMNELDRRLEEYEGLLKTLLTKREEITTQEKWQNQVAVVVDEATPPKVPAFPVLWLNLIIAGILGVIGGIIYAFFIEYLSDIGRTRKLGDGFMEIQG
jgi:uncharacterized protein involved in exopolysaccharide biosynthesis